MLDQQSIQPERPQTACSAKDGRETPLRPSSSQSRGSCSSRSSDHFSDGQEIKSSEEIENLASIIRYVFALFSAPLPWETV